MEFQNNRISQEKYIFLRFKPQTSDAFTNTEKNVYHTVENQKD